MEFRLRTLSPVHIGSGKEIEPFDYVVQKGTYSRVDLDAFAERLYELDAEAPEQLSMWITETSEEIEELDSQPRRTRSRDVNQQLSDLRRQFNLDHFARKILDKPELAASLSQDDGLVHYRCPISTDRTYSMKEQIKTADRQLYIPGSSLKGALRTALAFLVLTEADEPFKRMVLNGVSGTDIGGLGGIPDEVHRLREARRFRDIERRKGQVGAEIEKAVFRCGAENVRGKTTSYRDIHFDLMRSISISDTYDPSASLAVLQTYTFLRQVDRRNPEAAPRLTPQVPILLESLAPNSTFRIRINTEMGFIQRAAEAVRQGEWVELPDRFQRLFGIPLEQLRDLNDDELNGRAIGRLLLACQRFADAVIAEERRWAEQFTRKETGRLLDFYGDLENRDSSYVPVRLGWGSHFMSTTLLLALRDDPVLGPVMEDLVRAFEIDLIRRRQRRTTGDPRTRRVDLKAFPRSRRLAARDREPGAPFGWVELSSPEDDMGPALVETSDLLQQERHTDTRRYGRPTPPPKAESAPIDRDRGGISMQEAMRGLQRKQEAPKGAIRTGMRINAEVISNDGTTVVVRLTGSQNEEVRFRQVAFPHRPREGIKVRVQRINADGRVTQVVP